MSSDRSLLTIEIAAEPDVVLARQRARQLARGLGFDASDQTRIATAVSEIARNAFRHAGRAKVQFLLQGSAPPYLVVRLSDEGPGIPNLDEVLEGRSRQATGTGLGLIGAKKLVDRFHIRSSKGEGTYVELAKALPKHVLPPTPAALDRLAAEMAQPAGDNLYEEMRQQNRELLHTLDELKARQEELSRVNQELADTNSGVLALYAELEDKAEALRRSSRVKERFFSEMNHEVRTPINAILSLSELLLGQMGSTLSPDQERPLGYIRKSAQQLSELVDDLLDMAKLEAGKMVVRPGRFLLADLLGALRGMFRPLHKNEAVSLVFDEPQPSPELETDEGKVSQILRNLISNALKFTERGEVRVTVRIRGDRVVFAVSDSGVGIAPEDQAGIFEQFAQVEHPRQRRVKGTGIGLSLSRNLAELLDGQLTVESTLGMGATFTLSIPRLFRQTSEQDLPPSPHRIPRKVLVIDDDEVARYLLKDALQDASCEVVEALGGPDGLALARRDPPDAIFLDLAMPDMSGYEVLDALKADPATAEIPIIIHTARSIGPEERAALQGKTVAIVSKERKNRLAEVREALRRVGLLLPESITNEANHD